MAGGLGSSPGFLGIDGIDGVGGVGSGPVLSALPRPTADLGPLGGRGAGVGAPGIGVLGISGVIFLGTSTPRGFCPAFMLVISSPIVLIDDLYS